MVYSPYTWVDNTTVVNATRMNAIEAILAHVDVKLVTVTHDISITGDQAITGAGFAPGKAIVLANITASGNASIGFTDGTSDFVLIANAGGTLGNFTNLTNALVGMYFAATSATAIHKTMDADGMTITWSKSGAPTGTATLLIMFIR